MKKSFVAIAVLTISQITLAQWSNDSTVNTPVCIFSGNQSLSDIISDGEGGAIIVWEDYRGSSLDIYAQRINSAGSAQWVTDGIPIGTGLTDQRYAKIVSDGEGGAIIVWTSKRNSFVDIYAQKINAAGITQWDENGIAVYIANNTKEGLDVISDGFGGAIVSWSDTRQIDYNVYVQRILSGGELAWDSLGVQLSSAGGIQIVPKIVSNGIGGAYVVWQDYRSLPHIYIQSISSGGQPQWTANGVLVCSNAAIEQSPSVVSDSAGNAIIVWQDKRSGYQDLYAQRVDVSGNLTWNTDGVPISVADGNQWVQNMMSDGTGGAVIAWRDHRGNSEDIYAQKIDNLGIVKWTTNGVPVCALTEDQMQPDLIVNGEGDAIITWVDSRFPYNPDIYAQKLDVNGINEWVLNGIKITANNKIQSESEIINDHSLGAIITWTDNRNTNADIYIQQVDQYGNLGQITDVEDEPIVIVDQFNLEQNYPNPFNPSTKISWQSPVGSWQTLKVYDLLGREVATLVEEYNSAGRNEVEFDPALSNMNLASGIYFYQLKAGNYIQTKKMVYMK